MFGVHFLHASPTTYVMRYKNGQLVDFGNGLSLLYFGPASTIIRISQTSQEVPFEFEQRTLDFQHVTIRGSLTYRVTAPERLAEQLDFSVDSRGRYQSDDPDRLPQRLVRLLQAQSHCFTRDQPLGEMLAASNHLAEHLRREPSVLSAASGLGLEIESVVIVSIRADAELAEAMQADARQRILRRADEAAHERKKSAIELEREIQECQLDLERALQVKRGEVRQAELDADVAMEDSRGRLVTQQAANESKLSDARLETVKAMLEAVRDVDWRTLVATIGKNDSRQFIAMAFAELAENARRIGRLDISPDLLGQLIDQHTETPR